LIGVDRDQLAGSPTYACVERAQGAPIVSGAEPQKLSIGGLMASAEDVRRRIATVMTPVANLVTAQGAGGVLRQVLEIAIDGYGRMPSAKAVAARHLQRLGGSVDDAITSIIDHHIRLASAQGFVTNIGGVARCPWRYPPTSPVSPSCRSGWSRDCPLAGYDLNDNRVRTALVMCLMGGEQVAKHIADGHCRLLRWLWRPPQSSIPIWIGRSPMTSSPISLPGSAERTWR
jgi:hypothetical protein